MTSVCLRKGEQWESEADRDSPFSRRVEACWKKRAWGGGVPTYVRVGKGAYGPPMSGQDLLCQEACGDGAGGLERAFICARPTGRIQSPALQQVVGGPGGCQQPRAPHERSGWVGDALSTCCLRLQDGTPPSCSVGQAEAGCPPCARGRGGISAASWVLEQSQVASWLGTRCPLHAASTLGVHSLWVPGAELGGMWETKVHSASAGALVWRGLGTI